MTDKFDTSTTLQDLPEHKRSANIERLPYEPPQVISYTDKNVLEELGPAQAGTGYGLNGP
ncbi:hypothetical protein KFU94_11875 [Chloroflexi bacterium TSY]|nr:hypothetical protein [Chloroflexi bacterium TSY]